MKRTTLLLITGVYFIAISCEKQSTDQPILKSGILLENMDNSVKPGDDFNKYVNGTWIKTEIPADRAFYSSRNIMRDKTAEDVKNIIEVATNGNFEKGTDEQKIGDLYKSFMNLDRRNELGASPLQSEFARINAIQDYEDLARYFAYSIRFGYNVPLSLYVDVDPKNPIRYSVQIEQGGLGLPDRDYYLKNDPRSIEIRKKYSDHINNIFDLAGIGEKGKSGELILNLESRIAEKQMDKVQARNYEANYKIVPVDTLRFLTPDFNWEVFLKESGLDSQEEIVFFMIDYIRAFNEIVMDTKLDTWKTYLKWSVINANGPRLSEDFYQEGFNFFGKELYGVQEMMPLWRRGVSLVGDNLGELVGKVYVSKYFKPEAKKRMSELVSNLLEAYEISIKELDWMTEDTKKEALAKLSKFTPKIGYPDKWKEYDVDIVADDLFGNLKRSSSMEYERSLKKLGQPVNKEEWFTTPQTATAFYNPLQNEIVFPAAILQPPLFDMAVDDAVNYGAIGAVIGHEIGHGFDDQGSAFDGDGKLRNWWTDKDKEEFKNRCAALIGQYNRYEPLPGLYVNGEYTLGENIGDLGGLSIALKAYNNALAGQEAPVIDGFSGEQRFFIGYAQARMGKYRPEALRQRIMRDPHSPNEFRVNGVVRNIPEFYAAFNVMQGDSLFLPPEERVKIW
ncbi:MAG: M13 family metallopeptidase [Bacteroidota bacterium]